MTIGKNKKLKVPSIKKSVTDFLSNESGSVSTKSALAVWVMWAVTVWASWIVEAVCDISPSWHFNGTWNWHYSWTWTFWASVANIPTASCWQVWCTPLACTPINWIVNGHYNITPTCSTSIITKHCNHISSWDSWDSWDGWDSCG